MELSEQMKKFCESVDSTFAYLTAESYGCTARPPRRSDDDTRDESIVIRYAGPKSNYDIAYAPVEKSIGVLVKPKRSDVERRYLNLHLDPVVLFLSHGEVRPVVPQVFYGMSAGVIEKTLSQRDELFCGIGLSGIVDRLAGRLHEYDAEIAMMTSDRISEYHAWYEKEAKSMNL